MLRAEKCGNMRRCVENVEKCDDEGVSGGNAVVRLNYGGEGI